MNSHTLRDNVLHMGRGAVLVGLGSMVAGVCLNSPTTVAAGCVLLFGAGYALIFAKTGSY